MVRRAPAVVPGAQLGLQQGAARQRVTHDGKQQGQQPQQGEEEREQHVQPVFGLLHVEETPAPGALHLVGPRQQNGQRGHQSGEQPGEPQQPLHAV